MLKFLVVFACVCYISTVFCASGFSDSGEKPSQVRDYVSNNGIRRRRQNNGMILDITIIKELETPGKETFIITPLSDQSQEDRQLKAEISSILASLDQSTNNNCNNYQCVVSSPGIDSSQIYQSGDKSSQITVHYQHKDSSPPPPHHHPHRDPPPPPPHHHHRSPPERYARPHHGKYNNRPPPDSSAEDDSADYDNYRHRKPSRPYHEEHYHRDGPKRHHYRGPPHRQHNRPPFRSRYRGPYKNRRPPPRYPDKFPPIKEPQYEDRPAQPPYDDQSPPMNYEDHEHGLSAEMDSEEYYDDYHDNTSPPSEDHTTNKPVKEKEVNKTTNPSPNANIDDDNQYMLDVRFGEDLLEKNANTNKTELKTDESTSLFQTVVAVNPEN